MMEGNPSAHKTTILEGELLRMKNSGITRDLNRLIHPITKKGLTFLFLTYELIQEGETAEESWEKWTDQTLIGTLRDIGKYQVVSHSKTEVGLKEAVARSKRIKLHELNHDWILKQKTAMEEEVEETVLANKAKSTTKPLRVCIFDAMKTTSLGTGIHERYTENESERMVVLTNLDAPPEASSSSEGPRLDVDYSFKKFIKELMKEFIVGTEKVMSAIPYGGTSLKSVATPGGGDSKLTGDTSPDGGKRKRGEDYAAKRRSDAADAASGAATAQSVILAAQAKEKLERQKITAALNCEMCGRAFHSGDNCRLRVDSLLQATGHPDRNLDWKRTTWKLSTKGLEWAKKGIATCPMTDQLDGGKYIPIGTERTRAMNVGQLPIVARPSANRGQRGGGRGGRGYNRGMSPQPITFGCGLCNDMSINNNINNVLSHDIHDNELPYDEHGLRTCILINSHNPSAITIKTLELWEQERITSPKLLARCWKRLGLSREQLKKQCARVL
jgi:hypothetical protein